MNKLFLTSIAALFLVTGAAHAQTDNFGTKRWSDEPSPEDLAAVKAALATNISPTKSRHRSAKRLL
jgi:hypothetical protein